MKPGSKVYCPVFIFTVTASFAVAKCLFTHIIRCKEIKGSDVMAIYSFADVIKQKPFLKTKLKNESGGYTDCEVKLYSWGNGTVIKIEGVNVKSERNENIKLVLENMGEYHCNPCKNGYLFEVFFSDIFSGKYSQSLKINLTNGESVLASNIIPVNIKT